MYKSIFIRLRKAFTMVEVIAVLVIVGVLGAVGLDRMSISGILLQSEADVLKAHLRYVQLRSISQEYDYWGVRIRNDNWEMYQNSRRSAENLPGETSSTHSTPDDFTLRVNGSNNVYVNFDNWGQPFLNNSSVATSNISVTLTYGGESINLTITPYTGYIQ